MSLHRLNSVTIGVPEVDQTRSYYEDFGLTPGQDGWFATQDGGPQLRIVPAPTRRLIRLSIGADNPDDLRGIVSRLARLDFGASLGEDRLVAVEPVTRVSVEVAVTPRAARRSSTSAASASRSWR